MKRRVKGQRRPPSQRKFNRIAHRLGITVPVRLAQERK